VFQDGGLLALGANVFNMAIAGVAAGYLPIRWFGAERAFPVFLGGFLSVLVSAGLALAELWTSGVVMPQSLLLVSVALFVAAAVAEGVITVLAIRAIAGINPDWVRKPEAGGRILLAVSAAALVLAVIGILVASGAPDGLQSLANQAGFAGRERAVIATPFSGYETGWLSGAWLRQASAGMVGLCLVFVVSVGAARLLRRRA
jgi:cobalt/nickel transport system permease protein